MDKAIDGGYEGLMIKEQESVYEIGERSNKWLKMKPDHVDGMADTLDLVVVGGYYGTKFSSKSISKFLVALKLNNDFIPFVKVGTGYCKSKLEEIHKQLRGKWKSYDEKKDFPYWKPASTEKPDQVIMNPWESVVFEVKGSSVISSTKFPNGYTLRFPRFVRLRSDKGPMDCPTLKNILEIMESTNFSRSNSNTKKIRMEKSLKKEKKTLYADSSSTKNNLAYSSSQLTLLEGYNLSQVQVEDDLFQNLEFCVYFDEDVDGYNRYDIERAIVKHGGTVCRNARNLLTNFIVSTSSKHHRTKIWLDSNSDKCKTDIIYPSWIFDSIQKKERVLLTYKYLIFMSNCTEKYLAALMDEYEDLYSEPATRESLEASLERVLEAKNNSNMPNGLLNQGDIIAFKKELGVSELFDGLVVYFYQYEFFPGEKPMMCSLQLTELMFIGEGGTSVKNLRNNNQQQDNEELSIDYIVVDIACQDRYETFALGYGNIKVISHQWIHDCLKESALLGVEKYIVDVQKVCYSNNRKRLSMKQLTASPLKRIILMK